MKKTKKGKARRGSLQHILTSKKPIQPAQHQKTRSPTETLLTAEKPNGGWSALDKFLKAMHKISINNDPDKVASSVIDEAIDLLDCERATLFFVDAEAHELILVVAKGAKNIRIPLGTGIAGNVASIGKTVNIPDAYQDQRFSPAYDKKTGYRTRAVLCLPVREPAGDIVAVLQCINKTTKNAEFSIEDQFIAEQLCEHIGVTLQNCRVYENEREANSKVSTLLDIVKLIHQPSASETSLIFALSNKAHELVNGDRCTLYLLDRASEQLVVQQGNVDFRFPMTKGLAGYVASTGKPLLIDDAYTDDRFNPGMDKKTGYRTRAILCLAILGKRTNGQKDVIGVLQIINKIDGTEVFSQDDLELLSTLMAIAGPLLQKSGTYKRLITPRDIMSGNEASAIMSPKPVSFKSSFAEVKESFVEEEEEDEEDYM